MTWIILLLNIGSLVVSLRKRVLPFFLYTLYFLFLVVGQAFQIDHDLTHEKDTSYLYAYMTREGFDQALWFLCAASAISLLIAILAKGYTPGSRPVPIRSFRPPRFFYVFMFLFVTGLAGVLIFVVVGLSTFLNSSRPGFESGSTIFLTLLGFGIYPLLLKIMYGNKVVLGDLACAAVTLIVSMGFSRMHVILYTTSLLTAMYYGWGWADKPIRPKAVIGIGTVAILGASAFITIGALRNAQSYTGGSVADLMEYNQNHPDQNLMSTDVMYQRSIEGMSGLTGAFTTAIQRPETVVHDYGAGWMVEGVMLSMPGSLKDRMKGLNNLLVPFHWYSDSIIAPGIEMSYTSFGWLGALYYPIALFCFSWMVCLYLVLQRLTPPIRLCGHMLVGCGIFFVRGTFPGWIGYSIAYALTILGASPIWSMWVVMKDKNEGAALEETESSTSTVRLAEYGRLRSSVS